MQKLFAIVFFARYSIFTEYRVVQKRGCVLAARKPGVLNNILKYNVKKQHGV